MVSNRAEIRSFVKINSALSAKNREAICELERDGR
jgi:hypothetical protein